MGVTDAGVIATLGVNYIDEVAPQLADLSAVEAKKRAKKNPRIISQLKSKFPKQWSAARARKANATKLGLQTKIRNKTVLPGYRLKQSYVGGRASR